MNTFPKEDQGKPHLTAKKMSSRIRTPIWKKERKYGAEQHVQHQ